MKRTFLKVLMTLVFTGLLSAPAYAACSYTVSGKVQVDHQLNELEDAYGTSPLRGIQVRISGKAKILGTWGWYNSWDTVTTNDDGEFSLTKSKWCYDRRFKVEVKFDDSELEVRHATSTTSLTKVLWYVAEDETASEAHDKDTENINLGTFTFGASGQHDLNETEPRAHADIWVAYKDVINLMKDHGSKYEFTSQIKVKYPHDGIVGDEIEGNYANPLTQVIYIISNSSFDSFNMGTLFHELMHVWAYQHSTGESVLATYLISNGSTHGFVTNPAISFHEGFASYGNEELQAALYGESAGLPYSREGMTGTKDFFALEDLELHDDGVLSALRLLSLDDVTHYKFGEAYISGSYSDYISEKELMFLASCDAPELSFKQVLRVFSAKESAGYDDVIDADEMNVTDFYTRAADILNDFSEDDAAMFLELTDPESTVQPEDAFCTPLIFGGKTGGINGTGSTSSSNKVQEEDEEDKEDEEEQGQKRSLDAKVKDLTSRRFKNSKKASSPTFGSTR
jgi:hypothetical protein